MEARASMKYVRTSPRKMRRVIDLIRGQHVIEARRILRFSAARAHPRGREAAELGHRQRRAEPRHHRRQPVGGARVGRRRPHAATLPAARLRSRHQGPQAHLARHAGRAEHGRRVTRGTQSQSVRLPAGDHLSLEVQLVRRSRLRRSAPRGHLDPPAHPHPLVSSRHQLHRHRAQGRPDLGVHPHGPSRHRHRPQGGRGRPPSQGHRALHEEARRREGRGHEPGSE